MPGRTAILPHMKLARVDIDNVHVFTATGAELPVAHTVAVLFSASEPDGKLSVYLEPSCTCGTSGPDRFGNYDQEINPDCERCS